MSQNKNKGNNHQPKKLVIIRHILLVSTWVNVQRTVWRIWILVLGCKGLIVFVIIRGIVQMSIEIIWDCFGFASLHRVTDQKFPATVLTLSFLGSHWKFSLLCVIQFLWCSFGEFGIGSTNNSQIDMFLYSYHLVCFT